MGLALRSWGTSFTLLCLLGALRPPPRAQAWASLQDGRHMGQRLIALPNMHSFRTSNLSPSHFTDEMPKAQRDSSSVMSIHSLDSVVSDPLADTLTPQLSAPHCTYNSITSHSKTLSCGSVVPGESPVGSEEVSSASVLGASTERPHSSARTKPRLSSVLIRNARSGTTTRVQQSPAGLPSRLQEEALHAFCPFLEHTPPHWHTTSGHPASWFFQC